LIKTQQKRRNFSVEFTSKGGNTGKKGVQAKKITNFDLEGLSLEESDTKTEKKDTGMGAFNLGDGAKTNDTTTSNTTTTTSSNGFEAKSTGYASYGSNLNNGNDASEDYQEKIKKFGNAKSISSDAFYGTKTEEPAFNASKYFNSRSISSAQVFGTEEEEAPSSNATVDKLKSVASNIGEKAFDWGGKLKEKAGSWVTKFKGSEWSS